MRRRSNRISAILVGAALVAAAALAVQGQRGRFRYSMRMATTDEFDGGFNFCRVMFRSGGYSDSNRWSVDYPRADINLSIRLAELTKTPVSLDETGEPKHLLVRLTDEGLFQCPFVMMTEVGAAYFDDAEAEQLRTYLLKGGFLWADDFWGSYAWGAWISAIGKVLPSSEYPIVDLPLDHPLFRSHFVIAHVKQIPSINHWLGTGDTSERGSDSGEPHARAIVDRHGRVMVLMTHNTDFGDSWEREADDPSYFYEFAVDGYAMGVNVVLYSMTH